MGRVMADQTEWQDELPLIEAGTVEDRLAAEALIVVVDGYEGPLDLL